MSVKSSIFKPRLSKICLVAFVVALGFFVHELRTDGAFDLAFLVTGALGCVYLLLLGGEHYSAQDRYHSLSSRLREIQYEALPLPPVARERSRPLPHLPERRKEAGRSNWPRHLERRKSARPSLAQAC